MRFISIGSIVNMTDKLRKDLSCFTLLQILGILVLIITQFALCNTVL